VVTVLIAGGGTGGHVFPMVAVGNAIRVLEPSAEVFYVGTPRGMESRLLGELGLDLELLDVAPLRGGGLGGVARGAFKAVRSLWASRELVRRRRPNVVLSVGGYAGGPVALAARLAGVPLTVLEPNSVFGFTNRVLAPLARRVYFAFGDLDRSLRQGVGLRSGVPLRGNFVRVPYAPDPKRFRVAVFGGSQGAKALNDSVPEAFAEVLRAFPYATIMHQSGRGRLAETLARYEQAGVPAHSCSVVEFVHNMSEELSRADVVVQRSGASSLSELCLVGRASILVPYPFAVDDHQRKNAAALAAAGAAVLLDQAHATSTALARELTILARSPERRSKMADVASGLSNPRAAETVAADLLALAQPPRRGAP
jgi:UDP-N-acetylglucosamine--N-acetylmuramyl-(pentapeptide) pyrophosphoryl-undecaprenol N-acetylglucosamine transferase